MNKQTLCHVPDVPHTFQMNKPCGTSEMLAVQGFAVKCSGVPHPARVYTGENKTHALRVVSV